MIDSSVTECAAGETALTWNQQGPQGEQGDPGEQGPAGPEGPPGISGHEIVFHSEMVEPGQPGLAVAVCPDGKKVLGGGGASHVTTAVNWITSAPMGDDRWAFAATNQAAVTVPLQAYAFCAYVTE